MTPRAKDSRNHNRTSRPAPGRLFVIAAPSGAGKTSLVRALLDADQRIRFSVSYTTRPRRASEIDGRDYHFVDKTAFHAMRERGELLEYAEVFGNFYATGRAAVAELQSAGYNVLLEIDWQGAAQVRAAQPDCCSIFVLPPSRPELERRLRSRGTDSAAVIERRLADSIADMSHWEEFDHVIVNDDFDIALAQLRAIVSGGCDATRADRPGLERFVADLLGNL